MTLTAPWARQVAIFPPSAPLEPLPPVRHHAGPDAEVTTNFDGVPLERAMEAYLAADHAPIPSTADREGYHGDRHYDWWLSGLKDYLTIGQALRRQGRELGAGDAVLELGAASGRVARHFLAQAPGLEVWACDINFRHVAWMQTFLDPRLRAFQNTVLPHLPLPDSSFDLVSAFSVFTHIDEFETAWVLELRRLLKPGGIAYITVHSDDLWRRVPTVPRFLDALLKMREHITDYDLGPELFAGPMPRPRVVFRAALGLVYNTNVFHSREYLRLNWGRYLTVADFIPAGHGYQDVVVLQRPA